MTTSAKDAAAVEATRPRVGVRIVAKASASAAGTSMCRETVAGNASDVYEPPCPAANAASATAAPVAAAAAHARRNSAQPASYDVSSAIGARTVDSCSTTRAGSTPATFATSARKPCHNGNAYPGWSPPSGNSPTRCRDRPSSATSLRTRARWNRPSPPTSPATCQSSSPTTTPTTPTTAQPGARSFPPPRVNGSTATPATSNSTSVNVSVPRTKKVTASAPNTTTSAQLNVADAPRTPTARATTQPGARTTAVASASRSRSRIELIARAGAARRRSRARSRRRGTSGRAHPETACRARPARPGATGAHARPSAARDAWRGSADGRAGSRDTCSPPCDAPPTWTHSAPG